MRNRNENLVAFKMKLKFLFGLLFLATTAIAQRDYTTPVPILKQINRHNDDGSYSYGYEAADGSFKIETKYSNGEVYGKYGYVDDGGKLREVEYGASKRGFEPQGNDINVPPPTLTNTNPNHAPLGPDEQDDGQYREDPSVYYKGQYPARQASASKFQLNNIAPSQQRYNPPPPPPAPVQQHYNPPAQQPQYYSPPPVQPHRFQPQQSPPAYFQNHLKNLNTPQDHHPALKNIDLYSGSYSVSYTGR